MGKSILQVFEKNHHSRDHSSVYDSLYWLNWSTFISWMLHEFPIAIPSMSGQIVMPWQSIENGIVHWVDWNKPFSHRDNWFMILKSEPEPTDGIQMFSKNLVRFVSISTLFVYAFSSELGIIVRNIHLPPIEVRFKKLSNSTFIWNDFLSLVFLFIMKLWLPELPLKGMWTPSEGLNLFHFGH